MIVLECEAKAILNVAHFPIPLGKVVDSAQLVAAFAQSLRRPVVIKAQIPINGRMRLGGIQFADTPTDAGSVKMLGETIGGHVVDRVLVEERLQTRQEVFIAMTYDAQVRSAVVLASKSGGIEVEAAADWIKVPFSCSLPVPTYLGTLVASRLGFQGQDVLLLGNQVTRLAQCFLQWDALLLEINPFVWDVDGRWWIADAHLELDDDSSFRQQNLLQYLPLSMAALKNKPLFQQRAAEIDNMDARGVAGRLVPFDGDLGLLIGGGGASLTAFDAVLDAGLRPADYCEIGGNPSVWKVKEIAKLILSQPGVKRIAVITNVVSNTRVDLIARGVIKGVLELHREPKDVIVAFRVPGSWEEEGKAILLRYGVPMFGRETGIDQVVDYIKWQS